MSNPLPHPTFWQQTKNKKTTQQNRDGYFKYEIPISYLELEQKFV